MNHSEFQENIEYGSLSEVPTAEYILRNVATPAHRQFMAQYGFDIPMILNGRIVEDGSIPLQDLQDMIDDWNRTLGFMFIFTRYV